MNDSHGIRGRNKTSVHVDLSASGIGVYTFGRPGPSILTPHGARLLATALADLADKADGMTTTIEWTRA